MLARSAAPTPSLCPRCRAAHGPERACRISAQAATLIRRPILLETPAHIDPLVGAQVGNFVLKRRLGAGAMGSVYLAENPAIGSKVAVKFLHPAFAQEPSLVHRLYAEARAANQICHEHIVRALDLVWHKERGFHLILEYVPGRTLAERLQDGPLPLEWIHQVTEQICSALACAHAHGVIHRDLKPENILVDERRTSPQIKIADFGIAKVQSEAFGSGTALGEVLGTPAYMSPEQCQGASVDARADIYSLGVLAYQMCTGHLPFEGNVARVMNAHLCEMPKPPGMLRRDLPPRWNAAILRALAKCAGDRFSDALQFQDALREANSTPPEDHRSVLQPSVRARLFHYSVQNVESHYALLDLRQEAGHAEIAKRGSDAVALLRAIERGRLSPSEESLLRMGLLHVAKAISVLGSALSRFRYDGSIGNFRGAAVALKSLSWQVAQREHEAFLSARPDLDGPLRIQRARIRLARASGNFVAAKKELEIALQLDPLDPALHELNAELAARG